ITKLDTHVAAETIPGQNETTTLMVELLSAGATPTVRDAFVTGMVARFPDDFTRQGLKATWREIAEELKRNAANAARERAQAANFEMTPEERSAERDRLWPLVKELAEASDLMARVIAQVHSLGVVGETHLVKLVFIAGVSRLLDAPINPLVKGASSGGKSFVSQQTLRLFPPESMLMLTTSSPLSLVYDSTPLAHKIICVYEATQLQADETSVAAMLLRCLISEGKIIHQTTVEAPDAEYGRRTVTIVREGPISLLITTTGELHAENETRMLSIRVSETRSQTTGVLNRLGDRAAGNLEPMPDLSVFHDLQRWLALGPTDVVVPFAPQLVSQVPPHLVRFRRDIQQLLTFIKASALLHQAQRKLDPDGRVVATLDDYRLAYEVFVPILGQVTGRTVTDGVRAVINLVASRVLALDYNQIELRAAAEFVSDWCGQPSILRQAFADGLDAHTATAQRMTGKVRPEDVTPEERQAAKPCNFGLLYRMGARGFFNYLRTSFEPDITYEEASRRRDLFFAGYPDLARWQDEYSRHSRECGFTSTIAGRRWHWEWNAKSEEDVDPDAPFYEDQLAGFNGALAVNLPIQGSCAEVMMLALARLHTVLRDQPASLIATVHDEAVLLVPNDMQVAGTIADIARREMVAAFLDVFPNAPTLNLVDPKIGRNWGETQSLTKWLDG
ncbi:MAG: hypothetical protein F2811_08730, partial [Actinobacteria bacterium]|nr:hypothetical protein [Actinomycetota bacterium]